MTRTTLACFMLGLLPVLTSAWSPTPRTAARAMAIHRHRHEHQSQQPRLRQTFLSSTSSSPTEPPELSSAYDREIPASIVGEAVRAALRSDRGICFDFSVDRYANADGGEASSASGSGSRLVSAVKMCGKGTKSFINAKFSQSVPNDNGDAGVGCGVQLSPNTELVRKGHAFGTTYLTSKGRIIDRLLVLEFPSNDGVEDAGDAFLITSPGNNGQTLYNELSPLVFPMDQVTLTDGSQQTNVITLACSSLKDTQTSFNKNVLKLLMKDNSYSKEFEFPKDGACHHYRVSGNSETMTDVYVMQHSFLSPEICHGYTLLFQESENSLSKQIWDNLTDEDNNEGPVGVGALEYDTLRVEAGLPGYGNEMSGDGPKKNKSPQINDKQDKSMEQQYYAKTSPLELHLQGLVDTEKGCYQGQEGIASVLKNQRGPPRQLYQAVFYDSENDFDGDGGSFGLISIDNEELMEFQRMKKQADPISNDTRQPRPGDNIYVLGSNESIQVGTITSVAEPNGTGDAKTLALALAKRPGSILKAIKEQNLELPRWWDNVEDEDDEDAGQNIAKEKGGSGIMQPPPLDPLHNLEIVIGGSYTVGRLMSVPSRRYGYRSSGNDATASLLDYEKRGEVVDGEDGPGYFKYDFADEKGQEMKSAEIASNLPTADSDSEVTTDLGDDDEQIDELLAKAEEEAANAAAQAEAAAAEAKRKEEKMKLLKAKAEAAIAARAAAAEAKRKEEKMELLKAKAEAAMAARRKKRESS